jgi:hypothetical protein
MCVVFDECTVEQAKEIACLPFGSVNSKDGLLFAQHKGNVCNVNL